MPGIITGFMVAVRKTLLGINAKFAETTDQSCLNRFMKDATRDVIAPNRRRLCAWVGAPTAGDERRNLFEPCSGRTFARLWLERSSR